MDPTNECSICYEDFDQDRDSGDSDARGSDPSRKEAVKIQLCDHIFCRECLVEHCKHAISSRDIPIACPETGCPESILPEQVRAILCGNTDAEDSKQGDESVVSLTDATKTRSSITHWQKFQKYLKKFEDPNLVTCLNCEELFCRETNSLSEHINDLKCPSCNHFFCAVHGDAHSAVSCKLYRPTKSTDLESERIIHRITKPCSHCGIAIQKGSGCNHIICPYCKEDMCFKCGSHEYLSGEVFRSCRNCQLSYVDHRHLFRFRLNFCLWLPITIPLSIFYMVIAGAIAAVTCGCCCCLCCGAPSEINDEDTRNEASPSVKDRVTYRPIEATITVLATIFYPIVASLNMCGISCCLRLFDPDGNEASGTSEELDFDLAEPRLQTDGLSHVERV